MAKIETIAIADIRVSGRLREIEQDHVEIIAESVKKIGLLNPITIRRTPAAKDGKYSLVAGAHRLEACRILGNADIEAIFVTADQVDSQIIEIEENLVRNELSVIDRAIFVERLREIYEEKNGQIHPHGGRRRLGANLAPIYEGNYSDYVKDRLGLSKSSAKRLHKIAGNIHPSLKKSLRGTPVAENQAKLLMLTRLSADDQLRIAAALREGGLFEDIMKWVKPERGRMDPDEWLAGRISDTLRRLSRQKADAILAKHGYVRAPFPELPLTCRR